MLDELNYVSTAYIKVVAVKKLVVGDCWRVEDLSSSWSFSLEVLRNSCRNPVGISSIFGAEPPWRSLKIASSEITTGCTEKLPKRQLH